MRYCHALVVACIAAPAHGFAGTLAISPRLDAALRRTEDARWPSSVPWPPPVAAEDDLLASLWPRRRGATFPTPPPMWPPPPDEDDDEAQDERGDEEEEGPTNRRREEGDAEEEDGEPGSPSSDEAVQNDVLLPRDPRLGRLAFVRDAEKKHGRLATMAVPALTWIYEELGDADPVTFLSRAPHDTQVLFFATAALLEAATLSRLDGRTPWTLRTDIRPGHFPPLPLSENSTANFIEDGIGRVSMLYASVLLAPALAAATGAPLAMPPP